MVCDFPPDVSSAQIITAPCPSAPSPVVTTPPKTPLFFALAKARKKGFSAAPVAMVAFEVDSNGKVTKTSIENGSGSNELDHAIRRWSQGIIFAPTQSGFTAKLPVRVSR